MGYSGWAVCRNCGHGYHFCFGGTPRQAVMQCGSCDRKTVASWGVYELLTNEGLARDPRIRELPDEHQAVMRGKFAYIATATAGELRDRYQELCSRFHLSDKIDWLLWCSHHPFDANDDDAAELHLIPYYLENRTKLEERKQKALELVGKCPCGGDFGRQRHPSCPRCGCEDYDATQVVSFS